MIPDFTSGLSIGWSQVRPPCSSVVGRVSKRISLRLMKAIRSAGVLRSTGVTPFHRYYGPLRLPTVPGDSYLFGPPVALTLCLRGHIRSGLSGSSLNYRRPLSPLTPGSPSAAYARCFPEGVRFRPFWKVDRYHQ